MENKELENNIPQKEPTEKEVSKAEKQGAIDKHVNGMVSDADRKRYEQIMKEANAPIEVRDSDIKLGARELDVRGLTNRSWRQMEQRHLVVSGARLQSIDASLVDIQRLLMILLKKLGVEDIVKEMDNLYEEIVSSIQNKQK